MSIWWLAGDGGREPVVALVTAILAVGGAAYAIDWSNLIVSGTEHDIRIFQEGNELLPEGTVQLITDEVTTEHYRNHVELEMCDRFHFFCAEESNAFLSRSLQKARSKFNSELDALGKFTMINFFPVSSHRVRLYPELMSELDFGDPAEYIRYSGYRDELQKLSDAVGQSYKAYRRLIKRRLKV